MSPLPLVLRTLLLTALVIPIMTYVMMPWLLRRFAWWLGPYGGES